MSQPRRDWKLANAKRDLEGDRCRVCGTHGTELAHVIGRSRDERVGNVRFVRPDSVVPLCRADHQAYDSRALDLMPWLSTAEQAQAVTDAGGIEMARIRTCPSAYRDVAA